MKASITRSPLMIPLFEGSEYGDEPRYLVRFIDIVFDRRVASLVELPPLLRDLLEI